MNVNRRSQSRLDKANRTRSENNKYFADGKRDKGGKHATGGNA